MLYPKVTFTLILLSTNLFISPLYANKFLTIDKVGILCTISNASDDLSVRVVTFVVSKLLVTILGTIITLLYYFLSIKQIRRVQVFTQEESNLGEENLFLYPVILFMIFLPANIDDLFKIVCRRGIKEL